MEQLFLLPTDEQPIGRFRPGEIVRQTWPWIGCFDTIIPYWQVRFAVTPRMRLIEEIRAKHPQWPSSKAAAHVSERLSLMEEPDAPEYYCTAVPYGTFPEEIWWFRDEDLAPTGLSWRIPSWDEIEQWCVGSRGTSTYVAGLNAAFRGGAGERPDRFYPPYPEESELAALLSTLRPKWTDVTRDNFDSFFPACGRVPLSPVAQEAQLPLFA